MLRIWLAAMAPLMAQTPFYASDSIANSAANVAAYYAPNTFLTIYGTDLAHATRAISPDDIRAGVLPTVLAGAGVRVLINLIPADLYYVSPKQVNLLVPPSIQPGPVTLQLVSDGIAGPAVQITLAASAPALFQLDARNVLATHGNGPLVTEAEPGRAGEIVVLYGTGLGQTVPPALANVLAAGAAPIADPSSFRVLLNGVTVDRRRIAYAGLTPGYAGLYQINVQLPDDTPANPEIRVGYGDRMSPAGRVLPVKTETGDTAQSSLN
jgi:uncharacterized protein (TIGR03437 family)